MCMSIRRGFVLIVISVSYVEGVYGLELEGVKRIGTGVSVLVWFGLVRLDWIVSALAAGLQAKREEEVLY